MTDNADSAVSPVIGVLLMLVVTIIIAAVVSGFAGGLAGGVSKSPQASVDCSVDLPGHQMVFEHKGGDPFALKDVKVVLATEDTKTTLSLSDIGGNVVTMKEVGASDNMISGGDKFVLQGADPGWTEGIDYGSFSIVKNTRIKWIIVDKATDKPIASGTVVLL
jgi:flagellin-like protein